MRKLLNTLYVATPSAYLSKDGLNVVISAEGNEIFRIPILHIEAIVTFGFMGTSPGLMRLCAEHGVSLTFLSPHGRFVARVQGPTQGNVLLRIRQLRLAGDGEFALQLSQVCITAKIHNYRCTLRRFVRDYGPAAPVAEAAEQLQAIKQKIPRAATPEQLRGLEGEAANAYFGVLPCLILQQKADFPFHGRNKRPPRDAVNALLSLSYTLIAADVCAALETVGLDPYVGFLHTLRPGRPSLALDLMEELRAYLGDRFVLSLINRRQITPRHFVVQTEQSVVLTDEGRRLFLAAWQARKREEIVHPYLQEKIPIGLLPYAQAMLLARHLRGDIDAYPVFIIQ